MISYLMGRNEAILAAIGLLIAFAGTIVFTAIFCDRLPKDGGRAFAHDGKLSAGKPRGAGLIFVVVFTIAAFLFVPLSTETIIYLILVAAEMITGYMDDASEKPWGEWKKGILDLVIAIIVAVTYLNFNSNEIYLAFLHKTVAIPELVFGILIVILVWASINVTNCADGVDGLSGTLALITLGTFYILDKQLSAQGDFTFVILVFMSCILGYLWYNATPSKLMMGDAGSRAMGIFISIAALKSGSPLLYISVALVLILDGGLGLVKVTLIRVCRIHIMKNIRTPLHDHVRKVSGWSNTQTVFRFAIIQIVLSAAVIYGIR